jgi:ABC-type transporter Mla subunit MlaD
MAGDVDVRMVYQQQEQMMQTSTKAQKNLEETMQIINSIAGKLADNFQGQAGSAMQEGLKNVLLKKTQTLAQKMAEEQKDLGKAMEEMKQAVNDSKAKFA